MFYRRSKFMLVESYALEFNDSAREAAAAQGKDSSLLLNAPFLHIRIAGISYLNHTLLHPGMLGITHPTVHFPSLYAL